MSDKDKQSKRGVQPKLNERHQAHDGFARVIYPVHTPADGDTIFALSIGGDRGPVDVGRIGALAADVMSEAVLRAVT
jgi:L-aminopeptidase/D-esterase-like protein